ncbi:MAG: ATP-binding protein [Cyanobacteria bacterium J06632_22]
MQVGSERIQEIVLSLRRFSRLDESTFKPVDIHENLESTLMLMQHRLRETTRRPPIQVIRDYGELPSIHCAPAELNQVFTNILGNAIDALEQQYLLQSQPQQETAPALPPEITLRTTLRDNQWVEIAIADSGIGMTEALQDRIFDPFFTTKPVGQGTGMGLAISYQIVTDLHHGTLKCHSKVGQGTEFVIEIPVAAINA